MAQHTPGPWTVYHDDEGVEIRANDDLMGIIIHGKEMDANARLIGASPMLLAAAKVAVGYMQYHTEVCSEPLTCPEVEAYRQLVAAIALAGLEEDSDGG